jgi:hypothetical protein
MSHSNTAMSRNTLFFVYFFVGLMCWPLFCLCRPFMIFKGCLDSNPECCRSKRARYQLSSTSVDGLNGKRPIQCLASSKILTPTLSSPGECVPPPPLCCGGGHTRWVEIGWGANILEDARHSSVLYICKYFVRTSL